MLEIVCCFGTKADFDSNSYDFVYEMLGGAITIIAVVDSFVTYECC